MTTKGPKLKTEPFDTSGDRLTVGRSWQRWFERFECDLVYNGVDPAVTDNSRICLMALLIYAGPAVEDLHDSLAETRKPVEVEAADWTDYKKAKAKLNARFLPKKSNDFALCELMRQRAKLQESMVDYAARLRTYAEKCDFANWSSDKMIKCMVISSMEDEDLRISCLESDLRLDQVIDKIQMKEDTMAMSRVMGATSAASRADDPKEEKVQRIKKGWSKSDKNEQRRGTHKVKKCSACG